MSCITNSVYIMFFGWEWALEIWLGESFLSL